MKSDGRGGRKQRSLRGRSFSLSRSRPKGAVAVDMGEFRDFLAGA